MTTDLAALADAPHPWLAPDPTRGAAVHAAALATVATLPDPEPPPLREPCRVGCSTCHAILNQAVTIGVQQ